MRLSPFAILVLTPLLSACESAHMKKCVPECVNMHEECKAADEIAKFCKKSCTDTEGKTGSLLQIQLDIRATSVDSCKYRKHSEELRKFNDSLK